MPDQNQTTSDAPLRTAGPSTLERQALVALRKMRQKLDDLERSRTEPIAIVGIGCRLPGGANSPEAFWNLLRNGVDAITEVPPARWRIDDYFDPRPGVPGKTYSRWGGFMDRIDAFDADFFGISPREVVRMDPQQRVFLEVAWEALEDAGIPPHTLKESNTGIFVGTTTTDYLQYHLQHGTRDDLDAYIISGNTINATSGRLAFFLGTHGPTISMDTACSSSLVAVDRACRSVRDGECPLAIAGGVNLILAPELFVCMSKWGMLAPDGRCKTFDASADGFVRAEGCGIVILKRLRDALADGNRILAVIRGSAVNHDGSSSGLSVPNGLAQEAVIWAALNNAGVDPAAIGYVETHGTGTSLGDPIEVDALARVFQPVRNRRTPLALGSVKTNLGHLEAAAGVAGLLKVVLMLQHHTLAPHLHLRNPSPHIAWDQYPFTVPTAATEWSPIGEKRLAGVSAFGFSGTNVHLILEEAPAVAATKNAHERPLQILTLSARTETARWKLAEATQARLAQDQTPALADVCFTANAGRTPFGQRLSVVGATSAEIGGLLARHLRGETVAGLATSRISGKERHRIGFLFTGQGSQYAGMARQLFDSSPLFRRTLERCDELLRPHLERPLLSVLYPGDGNDTLIHATCYTQPALFAIEYALSELWRSWGVQPAFVMGHSVGEYVAACVAGVFGVEDGLKLIAERARLMQAEPAGGRMVAVRASEEQVRAAIAPFARTVALAAINGPQSVVISGVADQIAKAVARLAAEGVATKELKVSHAFHSPLMEPMLDHFETAVASVHLQPPKIRLVSNLTGKVVGADEITRPGYWRRHVREAVQFDGSVKTLEAAGCDIFLELGPAPVLLGMARQCVTGQQARWLPTLRPGRDDWAETLASVQALYHAGVPLDWKGFDRDSTRHLVALPTYPFQRERYWIESRAAGDALIAPDFVSTMAANTHPLAGELVRSPALTDTVIQTRVSSRQPAFLQGHQICGRVIFPATAYFELVLANAQRLWAGESIWIKDVALQEALTLDSESQALVQVLFRKDTDELAAFEVFSAPANAREPNATWTRHVVGRVHHVATPTEEANRIELARLHERCNQVIEPATFYSRLHAQGSQFGPEFRSVRTLHRGEAEAVAEIQLNETLRTEAARCRMHPALLDGCLQTSVAALPLGLDSTAPDEILMPVRIESVHIVRSGMTALWCHARLRGACNAKARSFVTDLDLVAADGSKVGEVRGFEVRRVNRRLLEADRRREEEDWLYEIEWSEAASKEHAASTKVSEPGTWLVLADSAGVALALRERLASMGHQCVLARPGEAFGRLPDGSYTIQPAAAGQFAELLSACESSHGALRGIIHLWSLNAPPLESLTADQLDQVQLLGCGAALHLVQAATALGQTQAPALWLVTRAAQAVTGSKAPLQPAGAPLIGLGRVIASEHPELTCRCVDLDAATTNAQDATDLSDVLLDRESKEGELAIRGGKCLVPRLVGLRREASDKGVQPPAEAAQGGIRLDAPEPRMIENLHWVRAERQPPGAGEVEVAVHASGLNFRDVLCALGMYPGKGATIGGECAGIVVRTGDGVTDLKPGDRVMGFAPASFASFVTLRRDFISGIPEGFDFSAAASIPVVFLTTLYGLQRLANLKQGDRVLIHAAAGGVGLSAVQLAQQAGAEIFATVGNPEKRAHLTALGVKHVFDSRSLSFADEVMRATGGRGVDVVLNSLAGDFIAKSVAVLAPGGRFLELGKRGILTPAEFAALRPDGTYYPYDLGTEAIADPSLLPALYAELLPALENGRLQPLPVTAFSHDRVTDAFRHMAQAKHIGKIVVTLPPAKKPAETASFHADATYLITGGFGGLGFATARWMADSGARHLVLLGRRVPSESAQQTISELHAQGVTVLAEPCDVTQEQPVSALLRKLEATMPPLRGVIHTAGVLDDGILKQLTWKRFAGVLAPKVRGAWLLHQLTASCDLDFFIAFSAGAAIVGAPGQGNYAAANAFMDALAHWRRQQGRPALSINWGAWAEAGMAARLSDHDAQRLEQHGLRAITLEEGTKQLGRMLSMSPAQIIAMPVNWVHLLGGMRCEPAALFAELAISSDQKPAGAAPASAIVAQLAAEPPARRVAALRAHVESLACQALGASGRRALDPQQPLHELGLDSLMSVELRNALAASLGRPLSATLLFDYPTVEALARHLATEVFQWDLMEPAAEPAAARKPQPAQDLEKLSESEAEALLLAELQQPKK